MEKDIDKRINRIVGQMQGIRKMIHTKRTTEAIAQQIMAAREALSRLGLVVIKEELVSQKTIEPQRIEKILKAVFGI